MKQTLEILAIVGWSIAIAYGTIFALAFFMGAVSYADPFSERGTCAEKNVNIERIWPVKHACWFWKEI